MIEFKNVFSKNINDKIENFSLSLNETGEIEGILCQSQVFQQALYNILLGAKDLDSGMILINGHLLNESRHKERILVITHRGLIFDNLTVTENVFFTDKNFHLLGMNKRIEDCRKLLAKFDFQIDPNQKAATLSQEEKIILVLLRCFVKNPEVIVINDLMSHITYRCMTCFRRIINQIKKEKIQIVYLTSQLEDALKIADVIDVVVKSRCIGKYTKENIKNDPKQIYYAMLGADSVQFNRQKDTYKLDYLREINNSIFSLSSGYDLKMILKKFALRALGLFKANNCIIYLSTRDYDTLLRVHAINISNNNLPILKSEYVNSLLSSSQKIFLIDTDKIEQEKYFLNDTVYKKIICICNKEYCQASGVIELCFEKDILLTDEIKTQLEILNQEFSMVIENSVLIGNSVMLQESHHRIKNNLQTIINLIQMESISIQKQGLPKEQTDRIQSIFDSTINRIESISNTHNLLLQNKVLRDIVDIKSILQMIIDIYAENAKIEIDIDDICISYSKAVSLALVVNELINNSVKYNVENRNLCIYINGISNQSKEMYEFRVGDNGVGFKNLDEINNEQNQNDGVGIKIIRAIVCYELGGELKFMNNNGAVSIILIPCKSLYE